MFRAFFCPSSGAYDCDLQLLVSCPSVVVGWVRRSVTWHYVYGMKDVAWLAYIDDARPNTYQILLLVPFLSSWIHSTSFNPLFLKCNLILFTKFQPRPLKQSNSSRFITLKSCVKFFPFVHSTRPTHLFLLYVTTLNNIWRRAKIMKFRHAAISSRFQINPLASVRQKPQSVLFSNARNPVPCLFQTARMSTRTSRSQTICSSESSGC